MRDLLSDLPAEGEGINPHIETARDRGPSANRNLSKGKAGDQDAVWTLRNNTGSDERGKGMLESVFGSLESALSTSTRQGE